MGTLQACLSLKSEASKWVYWAILSLIYIGPIALVIGISLILLIVYAEIFGYQ